MKRTMKGFKASLILIMSLVLVLAMLCMPVTGMATTDNPSTGSTGYETWVFHVSGTFTSTVTPIKFKVPWPYRALSVSVYARSVSGTSDVASQTVDVKQGTTSLLTTPVQIISSATVTDGTLATTPSITDEATLSVILNMTGTNPSVTDLTVVVPVKRQ